MVGLKNYGLSALFEAMEYSERAQSNRDELLESFGSRTNPAVVEAISEGVTPDMGRVRKFMGSLPSEVTEGAITSVRRSLQEIA